MEDAPPNAGWWDSSYESGEYLAHWDYAQPSQELVAIVAARVIPAGGTVLDVGCGAGREAIFLAAHGFRVIGVDISAKGLAIARQRAASAGVDVDWRLGNALALPVDDRCVDLINDRGCFHIIEEKDRDTYAAEMARVLKLGGLLFLRGSRAKGEEDFVPVTPLDVERHFPAPLFSCGPILPISLVSDAGTLDASIAMLERVQ